MQKFTFSPTPETAAPTVGDLDFLPAATQRILKEVFGEEVTIAMLQEEKVTQEDGDLFASYNLLLPPQLVDGTIKRVTESRGSLFDCYLELASLIEKRSNTWEIEGDEPHKEELLETVKVLSRARFDSSLFIGKGNAGHVFRAPHTKGYCIKYLYNPSMQRTHIEDEFILLSAVNAMSSDLDTLKVPQAHGVAKNIERTKNFFTMECIEGLTLEEIVTSPSQRKQKLSDFSIDTLIALLSDKEKRAKLLKDLGKILNAGIIHGDIHPRNIMINEKGEFYLIDFGNGYLAVNIPTGIDYDNLENRKELDMKTFNNSLDWTLAKLQEEGRN